MGILWFVAENTITDFFFIAIHSNYDPAKFRRITLVGRSSLRTLVQCKEIHHNQILPDRIYYTNLTPTQFFCPQSITDFCTENLNFLCDFMKHKLF
jgi:hypothetical protein